MPDYEYQDVLYETRGAVAYVTLNRPQALNALSNRLRGEMLHAMKVAERDESVNVIVLKANGRAFSAGYDLAGGTGPMESSYVNEMTGRPTSAHPGPGPTSGRPTSRTQLGLWNLTSRSSRRCTATASRAVPSWRRSATCASRRWTHASATRRCAR